MKLLTPYQKWMVKSNLKTIHEGTEAAGKIIALLRAQGYLKVAEAVTTARLEYLRRELRAERISYGELAELQDLAQYIDKGDVELLEAAVLG